MTSVFQISLTKIQYAFLFTLVCAKRTTHITLFHFITLKNLLRVTQTTKLQDVTFYQASCFIVSLRYKYFFFSLRNRYFFVSLSTDISSSFLGTDISSSLLGKNISSSFLGTDISSSLLGTNTYSSLLGANISSSLLGKNISPSLLGKNIFLITTLSNTLGGNFFLLGYNAVLKGNQNPTFRSKAVFSSLRLDALQQS